MKIKSGFVLTDVGDDVVAVPVGERTDDLHGIIRLNATGAFVWRELAEGREAEDIARRMTGEFSGVDFETALKCTRDMVAKLDADGFLEES